MGSEEPKREQQYDSHLVAEDRLQGKPLQVVSTSFVKPATATDVSREWLTLSRLDYMFMTFYTPVLCTYSRYAFGSLEALVRHLQAALAETLVAFYPLAGRLVTGDGPARIHCDDAGAVFTVATVDLELAELRTEDFQPQPALSGLVAAGITDYPKLPQLEGGLPMLIVQLTEFNCGGVTLAANWSHGAGDGQAGLHFMRSWSEVARGLEISLLPDHRRELVQPRASPSTRNPFYSTSVSPGAQTRPMSLEAARGPELTAVASKMVEFSKDEIARLKRDAPELSRADCFSAHLWRTAVRARRGLLPAGRTPVRLIYLVEGRKRLALPPGYFGNVIGFKTVITTVDELLEGPFAATAALIRAAVAPAEMMEEWFQDLVDFMGTLRPGMNPFDTDGVSGSECNFGVSYLIRLPFYELDFGFGAPACSTRNTMGSRDGLVFVVPSARDPDAMVAMVNLNPDVMPAFLELAHDIPE